MRKEIRIDHLIISNMVNIGSRVLDVGCANGSLLHLLKKEKKVSGQGIEINHNKVEKCLEKGLSVVEGDANEEIKNFPKHAFDYVILSQTLQAMMKPKDILSELLRIGSKAIVSFPNFGHWKIRLQLLISGKMPVTESLPYTWYDTPNIHFFTIRDFLNLCNEMNIMIEKSIGLTSKGRQFDISETVTGVNFFTHEAIFLLSYKNFEPIKIKSSKKVFAKNSVIAN